MNINPLVMMMMMNDMNKQNHKQDGEDGNARACMHPGFLASARAGFVRPVPDGNTSRVIHHIVLILVVLILVVSMYIDAPHARVAPLPLPELFHHHRARKEGRGFLFLRGVASLLSASLVGSFALVYPFAVHVDGFGQI